MSDNFLFKTPTLKSLVGTFMTEQGASKGDISEVKNYFSSKKAARVQMLDDLSSEFDPITDADSNYGRVLSLSGISRTNGVIPEDMDTSAEKKGRLESLAWKPANEVMGVAFQPLIDALSRRHAAEPAAPAVEAAVADSAAISGDLLPKAEVGLSSDKAPGPLGTDIVYIGKGDGSGQSTMAPVQQLWANDDVDAETDLKSGRRPFVRDIRQFRKANKAFLNEKATYWNKAPVQQLWANDDVDAETDLKSGRRPFLRDIRQFRKANNGFLNEKATYWNKAPVQQLFSMPAAFHDTPPRGFAPLLNPGPMGTNHAFLNRRADPSGQTWYEGMGDGAGVSTRGRLQQLAAAAPTAVVLPDAGELGTDAAFLSQKSNKEGGRWFEGMGDGAGQSTAATPPFGTDAVFMGRRA